MPCPLPPRADEAGIAPVRFADRAGQTGLVRRRQDEVNVVDEDGRRFPLGVTWSDVPGTIVRDRLALAADIIVP
jgi:hypothetical protein